MFGGVRVIYYCLVGDYYYLHVKTTVHFQVIEEGHQEKGKKFKWKCPGYLRSSWQRWLHPSPRSLSETRNSFPTSLKEARSSDIPGRCPGQGQQWGLRWSGLLNHLCCYSVTQSGLTFCDPWTAASQASLSEPLNPFLLKVAARTCWKPLFQKKKKKNFCKKKCS